MAIRAIYREVKLWDEIVTSMDKAIEAHTDLGIKVEDIPEALTVIKTTAVIMRDKKIKKLKEQFGR